MKTTTICHPLLMGFDKEYILAEETRVIQGKIIRMGRNSLMMKILALIISIGMPILSWTTYNGVIFADKGQLGSILLFSVLICLWTLDSYYTQQWHFYRRTRGWLRSDVVNTEDKLLLSKQGDLLYFAPYEFKKKIKSRFKDSTRSIIYIMFTEDIIFWGCLIIASCFTTGMIFSI